VPPGGPGWLVVAQAYSPQWKAEVDGRPALIEPTNYAAMGVGLPGGPHVVTFRLARGSLLLAGIVSGLATLFLIALWLDLPSRFKRRGAG
jgi:hypothetical protein